MLLAGIQTAKLPLAGIGRERGRETHQGGRVGMNTGLGSFIFLSILAGFVLGGCTVERALEVEPVAVKQQSGNPGQGWSAADQKAWSSATQGGRLIPLAWYRALEQPSSKSLFSNAGYFKRFGYLPVSSANGLPAGFAIDKQPDVGFRATKLRWYQGQTGTTAQNAEPWFGMTCGACHMSEIRHQGQKLRIYGGASMGDFQTFVKELDRALVATQKNPDKWNRFAARVLNGRDTPENREMLRTAFASLVGWQQRSAVLNRTNSTYGFGRVDALGRLYNKMTQFAQVNNFAGNPPSAPVSYPFMWGVWKQKYVQWNGAARNTSVWRKNPRTPDLGAFGRNAGQAIGVFGEVVINPNQKLHSSLNEKNLIRFERMMSRLQAPRWPDFFPAIDPDKAKLGKALFAKNCRSCHLTQDVQRPGQPSERMIPLRATAQKNRTEPLMACNAYTYDVPTGDMEGIRLSYLTGRKLKSVTPGFDMLYAMVSGASFEKIGSVGVAATGNRVLENSVRLLSGKGFGTGRTKRVSRAEAERICLTAKNNVLAYKARPLAGIWATAPYLHNGSVPTLYDMLLPAAERPKTFNLGTHEYDPVKVGYVTTPGAGNNFRFKAANASGSPVRGNSNQGHQYGTDRFSEEDRQNLLEYLKTL